MLTGAVRNGWITDQHGSWAMGFVPLGYGLWLAKPLGVPHLLMVGAWTCGFFFFAVAEKWLKFRFKKRYQPALYTYGGTAAIFSAILVVLEPQLWWWALVYIPLIAVSFFQSWARRERELSSRLVAIAAATLVLAVVVNINSAQPWFQGGGHHARMGVKRTVCRLFFLHCSFCKDPDSAAKLSWVAGWLNCNTRFVGYRHDRAGG